MDSFELRLDESSAEARRSRATGILGTVRVFAEQLDAIDVRRYEEERSGHSVESLPEFSAAFLEAVGGLLDDTAETFEDSLTSGDSEGESSPEQLIADTAVMAGFSLREKRRLLDSLEPKTDRWETIDRCDRCLRGALKSLAAVEEALCSYLGQQPTIRTRTQLDTALAIRTVYAKFQQEITRRPDATPETAHRRIRTAGISIAIMVGRDEYPAMRVGDRRQLRHLQQRIIDWLGLGADASQLEGIRLWQDVVSFTHLLRQINLRVDLIEHDRRVVAELYEAVSCDLSGQYRKARGAAAVLIGLDADLDRLIQNEIDDDIEAWRATLRRLHQRLCASWSQDRPRRNGSGDTAGSLETHEVSHHSSDKLEVVRLAGPQSVVW